MFLSVLVCCLSLAAVGQQVNDDWVDPYDMLNYDSSTKTMRKPTEPATYDNVATKRREYTQDSSQAKLETCSSQVVDLQKQIEEQKKKITHMSQQPTCNPVFKRFLSRLLKEIKRLGLPSDSSDLFYDAKIRLSKQSITEIQTLLEGEDNWRTGALDNAISQILVDLKPHDYEAWKWRFEDTFGVEIDTLLKVGLGVLVIMAIISTQLWSTVSWFVQFRRLFAVCFFVSIVWNWFYLYKIKFAEHQSNIAKMDSVYEKCTGVKKIDWSDSLKEWFRSTLTLQDDPCKKYYEVLMVNPVLLVPPTKAISVTITTFITEPLKHFGQGISEFLRALLKDLPVTLQIPVLLTVVLSIVVVLYASVQAVFQHGITAPLRRPRRDPGPPELEPHQPQLQRIEGRDRFEEGDAPQQAPRHQAPRHQANEGRLGRNHVRQRAPKRPEEKRVETLLPVYSEDETDAARREGGSEAEQNLSADSDSENQLKTQEEPAGASASSVAPKTSQAKTKPTESDSSQSKAKHLKVKKDRSQDEPSRDNAALRPQPAGGQPSQTDVPHYECTNRMVDIHMLHKLGQEASAEDRTSSLSLTHIETVGVPVQETNPAPAPAPE
ncbi:chloride channel CLIC-like protein 1 isoform X1 [Seriola lalandi dorsalis]|uniref:chloride channel CLIC-like protein 1 isoform X1 n=1 Tax=Seriola lalandi dorsalis TaxID=1841481 RepID=UPI000C6F48B2|nr:chloride channel CLIC-like protein 1 isoform X1 [Seriola lalandi dorsalis]